MLNIGKVEKAYLASGVTDLRKSIDGLAVIIETEKDVDIYEGAIYVFCNRKRDKLKVLHWDNGFWLYYHRLENKNFKWPNKKEAKIVEVKMEEIKWLLQGYAVRTGNKIAQKSGLKYY